METFLISLIARSNTISQQGWVAKPLKVVIWKDLLMFDDIRIPKNHIYVIWRDRLCCVDRSAKSFGCTYLMMIIIGIIHYSLLMFGSLLLHVQCSSCFPEVLTDFRQQWSCLKATHLPKIVFDEYTIWCSTITPLSTYIFSIIYAHTSIHSTSFSQHKLTALLCTSMYHAYIMTTGMIIPASKYLVTPIYKPFRSFGRGTTLLTGLTNHGY